jgi:hypothetical protein
VSTVHRERQEEASGVLWAWPRSSCIVVAAQLARRFRESCVAVSGSAV